MIIYTLIFLISLFFTIKTIKRYTNLKYKADEAFKGRQILSKEDFYRTYYDSSNIPKSLIIEILEILEHILPIEIGKLNPNDSFVGNLNFLWKYIDDYADIEIVEEIENKFKIIISDEEAKNSKSIHDIILLVAEKVIKE